MKTELQEILRDIDVQFDTVIPLIGSWSYPCDALCELIEDGWEDDFLIEAGFKKSELETLQDDKDHYWIADILSEREMTGILVKAAIPFPSNIVVEGERIIGGSHSWGHLQTKWFHVKEMNDLSELLPTWRQEVWMDAYKKEQATAYPPRQF